MTAPPPALRRAYRDSLSIPWPRQLGLRKRFPTLLHYLPTRGPTYGIGEPLAAWGIQFEAGWLGLFERMLEKVVAAGLGDRIAVTQAKEKWGTFRCYFDEARHVRRGRGIQLPKPLPLTQEETWALDRIVQAAERTSARTCEACGRHGRLYRGRPYATRCPSCLRKMRPEWSGGPPRGRRAAERAHDP